MSTTTHRAKRQFTAREAAARLGVSPRTIKTYMSETRSDYEARANERRRQILDLHAQGLTGVQIAETLGISRSLVSIRLAEHQTTQNQLL